MKLIKPVAKFTLATQILFPLLFSASSVASAVNTKQEKINHREVLAKIQSNLPELASKQTESKANGASIDELLAQGLSKSAKIISDDNSRDAAKDLAHSTVYGLASTQMTNWLNQYGNANIQIGSDKSFSGEFFLPFYETEDNLFFSQSRIQRQNEDRTTLNLGLGYRYFMPNKMLGINSFYDHDLKNHNARWGLGAELGADYVKLAANGYFRLTDWRKSRLSAFHDYDERPANGFDIRAEGFLPSYPQLGANIKYEKYFGDDVNLKGSNSISDLKKDPQAYTVGFSYTPVPLLSFKLNQSMGDVNETKGELAVNYRIGVPLSQQLDSNLVPQMRTLMGARYNPVDRNNTIVMQYKKNSEQVDFTKSTIKATSESKKDPSDKLDNVAINEEVIITVTLRDRLNNLMTGKKVFIQTAKGSTAGSQINEIVEIEKGVYTMKTTSTKSGTDIFEFTVDGKTSPSTVKVQYDAGEFVLAKAKIEAKPKSTTAGQPVVITVSLYDDYGNAVTGKGHNVTINRIEDKSTANSIMNPIEIVDIDNGVFMMNTTSTKNGIDYFGFTVDDQDGESEPASVEYVIGNLDHSTFTVDYPNISVNKEVPVDNNVTFTIELFDAEGNLVPTDDSKVVISHANDSAKLSIIGEIQKVKDGVYTMTTTSSNAGIDKFVLTVNGEQRNDTITVTYTAGNINFTNSKFETNKTSLAVSDSDDDGVTLTVTLFDKHNNPVTDKEVKISKTDKSTANSEITTPHNNHDGTYTMKTHSKTSGTDYFVFTVVGEPGESNPLAVEYKVGDFDHSTFVVDYPNISVDKDVTFTVELFDAHNNPYPMDKDKIEISHADGSANLSIIGELVKVKDGVYTMTTKSETIGTDKFVLTVNGEQRNDTITVTYTAGNINFTNSKFETNKTSLAVSDSDDDGVTLTVTLFDKHNNPVTDKEVKISKTDKSTAKSEIKGVTELGNGVYEMKTHSKTSGTDYFVFTVVGQDGTSNPLAVEYTVGDFDHSTFVVDYPNISVDKDVTFTVELFDAHNNPYPMDVSKIEISHADGSANLSIIGKIQKVKDGVYTMTTQSKTIGTDYFELTVDGKQRNDTITVTYTAGDVNFTNSKFETNKTKLAVSDSDDDGVTLTVTLSDKHNNPVTGKKVEIGKTDKSTAKSEIKGVTELGNGVYEMKTHSKTSGTDYFVFTVVGQDGTSNTTLSVEYTVGEVDLAKSTIKADKAEVAVDDEDGVTLTVTLKDKFENDVTGKKVEISKTAESTADSEINNDNVIDNGDGTYTLKTTSKTPGSDTFVFTVDGGDTSQNTATVNYIVGKVDFLKSTFETNKTKLAVSDSDDDGVTLTVTLSDKHNNPVTGKKVEIGKTDKSTAKSEIKGVTELGNGVYEMKTHSKTSGTDYFVFTVVGQDGTSNTTLSVEYTVGEVNLTKSTIKADKDNVTVDDIVTLTVELKDKFENTISLDGKVITISRRETGSSAESKLQGTVTNGTVKVSSSKSGTDYFVFTVDGGDPSPNTANVTYKAGEVYLAKSIIKADKIEVTVAEPVNIKVTLFDKHDNPVTGKTVIISTTDKSTANSVITKPIDNRDGTYTMPTTSFKNGEDTFKFTVNGKDGPGTVTVTYNVGEFDLEKSTIKVSPNERTVGEGVTVTVKLFDSNNNAVTGKTVKIKRVENSSAATKVDIVSTEENGVYTFTTSSDFVGTDYLGFTVDDKPGTNTDKVTYTPGEIGGNSKVTFDKDTVNIYDNEEVTITIELEDKFGNKVEMKDITGDSNDAKVTNCTGSAGLYTCTVGGLEGSKFGKTEFTVTGKTGGSIYTSEVKFIHDLFRWNMKTEEESEGLEIFSTNTVSGNHNLDVTIQANDKDEKIKGSTKFKAFDDVTIPQKWRDKGGIDFYFLVGGDNTALISKCTYSKTDGQCEIYY